MKSADYWVEICQQGRKLGAGFVLTRHYVLTALHCLRRIDPDDENLELSFASGEVVPGRVYECAPGADLALIDILKPRDSTFVLPNADRTRWGDTWFAPYRPSTGDPYLSGNVLSGAVTYQCEAGNEIEALQLNCSQDLGNYSGYSGGPVERHGTDGDPSLIGVLLEQYLDRHDGDRASDVLFAATIAEALRCFDCLGMGHLLGIMSADNSAKEPSQREGAGSARGMRSRASDQFLEPRISAAKTLLDTLHEWGASNVLNPLEVSMLKLRVAQRLVDDDWVDNA